MSTRTTHDPPPPLTKRQERAHRILDAAEVLILRWGYNKTTIDDIAKQAGVAKGTIYLHWKTREALFRMLMWREQMTMIADFQRGMSADPEGATLRVIFKQSALAMLKRPLLKAMLRKDVEVLGKLAQSEQHNPVSVERFVGFRDYFERLRERGWVRTDQSVRVQIYSMSAIFMGFFILDPIAPDAIAVSDEEIAELVGDAIHRTFESEQPIPANELSALSASFMAYTERYLTLARTKFQEELDT